MSGATEPERPSAIGARLPSPLNLGVPTHPFLSPLEQDIAAIVFERTTATVSELELAFGPERAGEVRAALDSLVARQVLRETRRRKGVLLYVQALRQVEIQQEAARRLAEEHFDGSLANAARLLVLLVHKHQPDLLPSLAEFMDSAFAPRG